MRTVTIDKDKFKSILYKNRARHEELYKEAIEKFYERLNEQLGYIQQSVAEQAINFQRARQILSEMSSEFPEGHCDEYNRVLQMLEYEVGDTINLTADEFEQYVNDDWHWKRSFAAAYHTNTGKLL